jgi:hypothetical protein
MLKYLGIIDKNANGGMDIIMNGAIAAILSLFLICIEVKYKVKVTRRLPTGARNTYGFILKPVTIVIEARRRDKNGKGS